MDGLWPRPVGSRSRGVPIRRRSLASPSAPGYVIPPTLRSNKQIHSGHSLVLRTLWSPDNPPYLFHSLSDAGDMGSAAAKIVKSVILGSSSRQRWDAAGTFAAGEDAKNDIGAYQTLTITEGFSRVALPYRNASAWDAEIAQSRDYMGRFVANARTAGSGGAGAKVYLYTVWPAIDGSMGDFRAQVEASEQGWHWLQDKLAADTGYRPTIIPGHRLMMRIYDDVQAGLVPGVATFASLFVDDIHPTAAGAYAVACLHYAVLYGVSPVGLPAIGVTVEQATYFQSTAWSVAEPYARAGLGGSDQGALGVDPSKEGTSAITTPQPLDIIPFRASLDANGKVVSIPNSGSAGAAHDLTAGSTTMTLSGKGSVIEMRSARTDYLILGSSFDLRGRRLFLPLRRDTLGSERIMGNASNEVRFVNTSAGPSPASFFRLKIGALTYDTGVFPQSTAVVLYEFEVANDGALNAWYNGGAAHIPVAPHGIGPASGAVLIYNLGRGTNNTNTFNGGFGQLRTLESGYSQAEVDAIRQSYVDFFAGALVIDTAPITP